MSEEKRRFTRVLFRVSAEIMAHDFSCRADEILNLSVGGCLLPVKADLEPGTGCDLKIIMAGTTSELNIRVKGEIVRSGAGAVAVKFTGIDPESLFHLQNIIRYNLPDPEAIEREIRDHPGLL
ncbi:MAG: PilZ domain-containing protein [Desulfobacterales bacterium]|nr:PilZ domain-containing protein [Desulfobacterales bacterium]